MSIAFESGISWAPSETWNRSQFEQSQLNNTEERLTTLRATVENEDRNLARHNQAKVVMEEELREAEENITTLREEHQASVAASDEKTKRVEQVKKTTARAAKVLDQALKEIATKVRRLKLFSHP